MSVCAFNPLPKEKYSNLFIIAAFSRISFSGKMSLSLRNSYLPTVSENKTKILAVCLSKSF